jgi:hypothetical protein
LAGDLPAWQKAGRRPRGRTASILGGAGGPERVRVATHIFTQPTGLNALFDAVDRGLRE